MDTKDPVTASAGRIGAYETHARHDVRALTQNARSAFLASFTAKVDPEGLLAPEERERRALALRKAHFARLAMKSAKVRRAKQGAKKATGVEPVAEEVRDATAQPS